MSKRFTATEKWSKEWFRSLPPRLKCFWSYLCDTCDHAGVWEPDYGLASFQIGEAVTGSDLAAFGDRVSTLPNGKIHLVGFVKFQYPNLSPHCKPHAPVFAALDKHGLPNPFNTHSKGTGTGIGTGIGKGTSTGKGGTGEKEPEKEPEESPYHVHARTALHYLNEKAGRAQRETDFNLTTISGRLREPGVTIEGVMQMIDRQCAKWKADPKMSEFLRVETLFGKQKFDGYYSAKDLPVVPTQGASSAFRHESVTMPPAKHL